MQRWIFGTSMDISGAYSIYIYGMRHPPHYLSTTLLKNRSRNFDMSINMALANRG